LQTFTTSQLKSDVSTDINLEPIQPYFSLSTSTNANASDAGKLINSGLAKPSLEGANCIEVLFTPLVEQPVTAKAEKNRRASKFSTQHSLITKIFSDNFVGIHFNAHIIYIDAS
jgi:hypothetical protein